MIRIKSLVERTHDSDKKVKGVPERTKGHMLRESMEEEVGSMKEHHNTTTS